MLRLMAEGRSNGAIATHLVVTDGAVEKHVSNIFTKLDLPQAEQDHRRVLAVLRYLDSADPTESGPNGSNGSTTSSSSSPSSSPSKER